MTALQQHFVSICFLLLCISALHTCRGSGHDGLRPLKRFRPTPRVLTITKPNSLLDWKESHLTPEDKRYWKEEQRKRDEARRSGQGRQLLEAARVGNAITIWQLLANGVPVDFENDHHETALFYAARHGHAKIVKLLISAGARADSLQDHSFTPALSLAAGRGNTEIVELLLSAGAPVNYTNRHEEAPLTRACRNGHQMIAQRLLQAGACVHHRGGYLNSTLLMEAADDGQVERAQMLLRAGARIDETTPWGNNAIKLAAWRARLPLLKLLLDTGANLGNAMYRDVLLFTAQKGQSDAAQLLRRYGARLPTSEQDVKRFTAAEHVHLDERVPAILRQVDADAAACAQATREWLLMLERTQQLPRDIARLIWQFNGSAERSLLSSAQEFTRYP